MIRKETLTLWCELATDELLDRGEKLAKANAAVLAEEDRQTGVKKAMKEQLTGLAQDRNDLATIVEEKREERAVVCLHEPDYARQMVNIVREDTGELIETRQMTDAERQREMFTTATSH